MKELDLGEPIARESDNDGARRQDQARNDATLPGREVHRCRSLPVRKILDPTPDRELDYEHLFRIAESARTIGFLHPIAVRKAQVERKGELRTRTVLVAGAYRLAAARHLGYKRIECIYIDYDDEISVQLVEIGEDLFRKHVTVLRHAELVAKWYKLVSKENHVYGQHDRKNKLGRPPSGISRAARDLPIGTTVEARRKIIQRARKIARIQPDAKQAAIEAGLDDNQRALLAVAAAHGRKAQLRKLSKFAKSSANRQDKDNATAPNSEDAISAAEPKRQRQAAKSTCTSSDQQDAAGGAEVDESERKRQRNRPKHSNPETSLEQLEQVWQKKLRELWKYAPSEIRERFITILRSARSKAPTDYVKFIRGVFQGHEKVYAKQLYALAGSRGLSKNAVRITLKQLGYRRKRTGYWSHAQYYYLNTDSDWKEELSVFESVEMKDQERDSSHVDAEAGTTKGGEPQASKAFLLDDYFSI